MKDPEFGQHFHLLPNTPEYRVWIKRDVFAVVIYIVFPPCLQDVAMCAS